MRAHSTIYYLSLDEYFYALGEPAPTVVSTCVPSYIPSLRPSKLTVKPTSAPLKPTFLPSFRPSSPTYGELRTPSGHVLLWSYQLGGELRSSPAIGSDGSVYVASYSYASDVIGYLYAFTPFETLRWWFPAVGGFTACPASNISRLCEGSLLSKANDSNRYRIIYTWIVYT